LIIDGEPAPIVARARERGLLVSMAGSNVIRFAPPLIVSRAEVDQAIEIFDEVLGAA
jgi:4-aminobutyrate aminotransferase-like enzyme